MTRLFHGTGRYYYLMDEKLVGYFDVNPGGASRYQFDEHPADRVQFDSVVFAPNGEKKYDDMITDQLSGSKAQRTATLSDDPKAIPNLPRGNDEHSVDPPGPVRPLGPGIINPVMLIDATGSVWALGGNLPDPTVGVEVWYHRGNPPAQNKTTTWTAENLVGPDEFDTEADKLNQLCTRCWYETTIK